MSRIAFLAALLLTCGISLPPVAATLIDANDLRLPGYQSADGLNSTHDTLTSLEWLDIDTTKNISFNAMSALLGVGELRDFRYASLSEIDTFFNHLGLPTAPLPGSVSAIDHTGSFGLASRHTGLTGLTSYLNPAAMGLYADAIVEKGGVWQVYFAAYSGDRFPVDPHLRNVGSYVDVLGSYVSYAEAQDGLDADTGNWIVRDCRSMDCVIPEPLHLGVWGLGALVLAVSIRCKRQVHPKSSPLVRMSPRC